MNVFCAVILFCVGFYFNYMAFGAVFGTNPTWHAWFFVPGFLFSGLAGYFFANRD